jgi:hypothetical protein
MEGCVVWDSNSGADCGGRSMSSGCLRRDATLRSGETRGLIRVGHLCSFFLFSDSSSCVERSGGWVVC